jgi:hypothetical protein
MDESIRPITRADIAADAEMAAVFVAAGGVMPQCRFPQEHHEEWRAAVKRFLAQHDEGESSA